jgi:C-terminal processing protease CtpA/Prc
MDSIEALKWAAFVVQLLNALATAGVWLYVRYGDRNQQIDSKFESVESKFDARLDEQDRVIARLTGMIERAPTHNDLSKLYDKVNTTAQAVSQMSGEMKGINENLRLILSRIAERGMQ